ncbi:uncharacterized protein LOC110992254 [Pieris rapae]|uniref:uncharacterized protein LOC110992254 n=1 Tax=Pieris rapae TaxID=64459 RepID=UPI001E27E95A|nr:uncharacterized protein LOC110992254 [Pieris rapae]
MAIEPSNYGTFSVHVKDFQLCKGPKRRDCCDIKAKMLNDVDLSYDIVIKEDIIPTRGKVYASVNGKSVIRLQMKKPCDHLFMKPLFQALLNVTDDCTFRKGKHHIQVNLDTVAQKYYGGMFLYGNITFKSVYYNDKCNLSCSVLQVELLPKTNTILAKN